MNRMIARDYYIELIEEIRNTEKISIDDFIKEKLEPLMKQNNHFVEILYKDIYYLIKDIDKEGEGDLAIENGSLIIESDGLRKGIKLTGYQSRLHQISIWLHMQIVEKFMQESPLQFIEKMEDFEKYYLSKSDYTPEYRAKLDKIKESLIEERRQNLNEKKSIVEKTRHWKKKRKITVLGSSGILAVLILIVSLSNGLLDIWSKLFQNPDNKQPSSSIIQTGYTSTVVQIGRIESDNVRIENIYNFLPTEKEEAEKNNRNVKDDLSKIELSEEIMTIIPNSYFIESNENEFNEVKIITNHLSEKLNNVIAKRKQAENNVVLEIFKDTVKPEFGPRKTTVDVKITIANKDSRKHYPLLSSKQISYDSYNTQYRNACEDINKQIDSLFNDLK